MATPTPSTYSKQTLNQGVLVWSATWATTDNFTDQALLDLSALQSTNQIMVERLVGWHTTGITVQLEFDDDSADELFFYSPEGHTTGFDIDFTAGGSLPGVGYVGSGGTGDVVLTTTSAASGDSVYLVIFYRNT